MNQVQTHYENLLAEHYTWMFGDYNAKVQENIAFLKKMKILPQNCSHAIDLGCGSGFQSMALSELGFLVHSFDFSRRLLDELESHCGERKIYTVQADILNFNDYYCDEPPEVIVCMGDTLTHLVSLETVALLLRRINNSLRPGGRFIVSYRDMTQELIGLNRFIPIRSDADKIMTAFLEYQPGYVIVHDLIHSRFMDNWVLNKSSYKKLRINVIWLKEQLSQLGMDIEYEADERGFVTLVAVKK